jgi:hypothetical protein
MTPKARSEGIERRLLRVPRSGSTISDLRILMPQGLRSAVSGVDFVRAGHPLLALRLPDVVAKALGLDRPALLKLHFTTPTNDGGSGASHGPPLQRTVRACTLPFPV